MKTIYNMSIEELLANNEFEIIGKESAILDDVYCESCEAKLLDIEHASSLETLTVTCPTVTIQKTASVLSISVTYRSHSLSIDSPTGWKDFADVSITIGNGWGDQPVIPVSIDGSPTAILERIPNTATNFSGLVHVPSTNTSYRVCADSTCFDYTSSIAPPNIVCTSAPTPTSPSVSEIDISFTWTNTGVISVSFTPGVSINGGPTINLVGSPVTLGPGNVYDTPKTITGLSLTPGAIYTVCPVPN